MVEPLKAMRDYAAQLAAAPVDLCCLGIGENGHLAFNDPAVADFSDLEPIKLAKLGWETAPAEAPLVTRLRPQLLALAGAFGDAETLRATFDKLAGIIAQGGGPFLQLQTAERSGRT